MGSTRNNSFTFSSNLKIIDKIVCELEENNYDEKLVNLEKLILDLSPKKEMLERELESIESFNEITSRP